MYGFLIQNDRVDKLHNFKKELALIGSYSDTKIFNCMLAPSRRTENVTQSFECHVFLICSRNYSRPARRTLNYHERLIIFEE